MKKRGIKFLAVIVAAAMVAFAAIACSRGGKSTGSGVLDYGDPDLSGEKTAGLENAANYRTRYKNGSINIGDVMPLYHDGIYSFFYLAETSNHPVYRVDTTDFIHYEEKGEVLSVGDSTAQDSMIGTGSIVRAGNDYYFFYTGHKDGVPEKVMVAKSEGGVDNFVKVSEFILGADGTDLEGFDFRDPEARYDEDNRKFILLVSARRGGAPVIAKFTVSLDLAEKEYKGVVYTDDRMYSDGGSGLNVLECPDLFQIGDKWYLTYSVQDLSNGGADTGSTLSAQAPTGTYGKMYYAMSSSADGPFARISDAALDSYAFYAGKSISDGTNTYLAGWVRKKGTNLGWAYSWGGNLQVHKLTQNDDGTLNVTLPDSVRNYYSVERELDSALAVYNGYDLIEENSNFHTVSKEYSSYLLHTYVTFTSDVREAGFALGVGTDINSILKVAFVPFANKLRSGMNGNFEVASKYMRIVPGREYDVTLLVEGSCVTMYVDGSVAFTSRIANIGNKKIAVYAEGGTASFRDFHLYTPSGFADTLGSGYGELTVTENGAPLMGRVTEVAVSPSSPATVTYKAEENNYLQYTAAIYSDKAVTVTVKKGGAELDRREIAAAGHAVVTGSTLANKGEELTVIISAAEEATASINVSVETDKKPFAAERKYSAAGEGTQSYTAGEAGVYRYVASMYYGGDLAGRPRLTVGGATAEASEGARLVTVRGAARLAAGEKLNASLVYGEYTAAVSDPLIALEVYSGAGDVYAAGVGTVIDVPTTNDVISGEDVVMFGDIELTGIREMGAEMSTDTFGEQGKNGFVYAYGRAGDELMPMTEYNDNGEVFEYKHRAPEANSALEIKADFMKQSGGYVTAVGWIAPADGAVDYIASYYNTECPYVQVRVYRNRTLLYDKVIEDSGSRCDITLVNVEVKAGDALMLAVATCGTAVSEGGGNYTLRVGEGNSTIPYNPDAPLIADYNADFTAERQGDYGWHYMDVGYAFDPEHPTEHTDLAKTEYGWGSATKGVDRNGVLHGGNVAAVWVNETENSLGISVSGSVSGNNGEKTNAWMRVWVIRADGRNEQVDGAGFKGTHNFPNKGFILKPGDMIAFIAFDNNADGLTLDIKIRTTDAVEIDLVALEAEINAAEAINNNDSRYTPESFARLTAAIATARNFLRTAQASPQTYTEIAAAVKALKDAVKGLVPTTATAQAALEAAINEANKFDGKELLGDKDTFNTALNAAKAAQSGSDAAAMVKATEDLQAAMENVSIKVAELGKGAFPVKQGENGFLFYRTDQGYDPYHLTAVHDLAYDGEQFKSGDQIVNKELWKGNGTAIAYRNYTATAHKYSFYGTIDYIAEQADGDACVAIVIMRADGTFHTETDWNPFESGLSYTISLNYTLNGGDALVLVLRDVDRKPTDSKITMRVGCDTDTLTVDTSRLSALKTRADEITERGDYTEESYGRLTDAKDKATTELAKGDHTPADVYAAERALDDALNGLESTGLAELLTPDSGWSVYKVGIEGWEPAHFTISDDKKIDYANSKFEKDNVSVVNATSGYVKVNADGDIAFMFTAKQAGNYRFEFTETSGTRGNGRFFVKGDGENTYKEAPQDSWIGDGKSYSREIALSDGESILFHFEKGDGITDLIIKLTATLLS